MTLSPAKQLFNYMQLEIFKFESFCYHNGRLMIFHSTYPLISCHLCHNRDIRKSILMMIVLAVPIMLIIHVQ